MHITYLRVEIITNNKKNQVRPEIKLQPQIYLAVWGILYAPDWTSLPGTQWLFISRLAQHDRAEIISRPYYSLARVTNFYVNVNHIPEVYVTVVLCSTIHTVKIACIPLRADVQPLPWSVLLSHKTYGWEYILYNVQCSSTNNDALSDNRCQE